MKTRNWLIPVFAIPILMLPLFSGCKKSGNASGSLTVDQIMSKMTMEQKVDLLGGVVMSTKPMPKLGIPSLRMDDGPLGARWGRSTSFPAGIAMASTWDTALVRRLGQGIGREVRGKGRNIILGPNVNIARNPLNGRTFEGFGEDPFLTSEMGVSYIDGVQEEGIGATVKHFDANNQEFHRHTIDEKIDERTLREIYFPAFKAAVQRAHSAALMASYNQVNGQFAAANHFLLNTVLRKEWGYKGLIMSDWGAVHATFPTVNNAEDLEMPTGKYLNQKTLMPAIKSGKVSKSTIDSKVRNILNAEFRLGVLPTMKHPQVLIDSLINAPETHRDVLQAAKEAIVLLKNDRHALPINVSAKQSKPLSIAVIGPNAAYARTVGGGSAQVHPIYSITPLEALKARLRGKAEIHYAPGILFNYMQPIDSAAFYQPDGKTQGLKVEYFSNNNFSGTPIVRTTGQLDYRQGAALSTPVGQNKAFHGDFTVRWTGKVLAPVTGDYEFGVRAAGPTTVYLDGKQAIDIKGQEGTYKVHLEKGHKYDLKVEYHGHGYSPDMGYSLSIQLGWQHPEDASINNAVRVASHSDVAIVFAGTSNHFESEGFDRKSLELPDNQDELIQRVARANKHTIVVLTTGAPVLVNKWINQVPAVLESWFDGSEIGNAIADVILGNYNPSGKLPITFVKTWSQEPEAIQHYNDSDTLITYSDGLYVGYRYFDSKHIKPEFPFGYGLSYTSFKYSDLNIQNNSTAGNPNVEVSFRITNTGHRSGAEIAQVYVHEEHPELDRPEKALKGFARVELNPGQSQEVHLKLAGDAFHYFNPDKKAWVIDPNKFDILVGSSSADIHLQKQIALQ